MAGLRKRFRWVALALVALAVGVATLFPAQAAAALKLPLLAVYSVSRMVAAYLLALVFAVAYGTTAATNKRAAVVMLPLLDVLQSIPILGFFPAALVFFVSTFQGSPVGLEVAVVFLIFTSMAWNMAFGVYESLSTIPHDLEDAAASFGVRDWLRFRRLALPAVVPKLVYNSILSWTNGWFFLVASEVFTAYGATYARPGLGAFIADAGQAGDYASILIGIGALAAVVLALDTFVWRPLSVWAERFKVEAVPGREVPHAPGLYQRLQWLPRFPRMRAWLGARTRPILDKYDRASARLDRVYKGHATAMRAVRRLDLVLFLAVFVLVVGAGLLGLAGLLLRPLPPGAADIPAATALSFARLGLAYVLALAWTIPVAAWIGRSERASRFLTPALEVFASIPATALLPLILGFSIAVASGVGHEAGLAALLIALFSMQWYLLFNLVAGVRGIPGDLEEAARSFGLRGLTYWRRVLLPAMVPSLLTGSITAWGAGWNALIVSEYLPFHGRLYEVEGIGALMDRATFGVPPAMQPNAELLFLSIVAMIVVVLLMNKLLWHPLFRRASMRFRMEA